MADESENEVADLTIRVLREIRDEVKKTNVRLDQTNTRLDGLQTEMHQGFERLDRRVDELRVETHKGFEHVGKRIDNLLLGEHREQHEELRERVSRIEQHLGLRPQ